MSLLDRLRVEQALAAVLPEQDARRFAGFAELEPLITRPDGPLPDAPPALHAAALLLGRLAEHDARALLPLVHAWERLGASEEGRRYLASRGERAGLEGPARDRALDAVLRRGVEALVDLSRSTDDGRARDAVGALRTVAVSGGPAAPAAREALAQASAAACARFDAAAAELTADVPIERVLLVLRGTAAADRRLGGDPLLWRRVVGTLGPIAWRSYTGRRWPELRALLAEVAPIVRGLEAELCAAPDDLAFRAALAQLIVFESEMAGTLEAQLDLAERALAICPTLRNARVVLAAQLVARAEASRRRGTSDGRADLLRALELDPHQRRARELLGQQ